MLHVGGPHFEKHWPRVKSYHIFAAAVVLTGAGASVRRQEPVTQGPLVAHTQDGGSPQTQTFLFVQHEAGHPPASFQQPQLV